MANIIQLKNGDGAPTDSNITDKEVAIDLTAQALYVNDSDTIKQIGLPTTGGAMTGAITTNSTFDGIDIATRDADLTSTILTASAALPKSGGTMTGNIAMGDSAISGIESIAFQDGDAVITEVKDEDTMASDSNTKIATQQSIKAYVDDHPEWIHFPRMSVRMSSTNTYYLGSQSLGTTIGDSDFVPSDFEKTNVALLHGMQDSGSASVKQARIFITFNGAGTDSVEVRYLRLRGTASLSGEFNGATTLTVESNVLQDLELADDIWYHVSTTLNMTLGMGDIVVPVFMNKDNTGKTLYYSVSYKVYNKLGTA